MKIYPKSRLDKTVKKIKYGLAGIFFQESILPTWRAVACEQTRFARLHVTARRTCISSEIIPISGMLKSLRI